jgi:hypothetical protein
LRAPLPRALAEEAGTTVLTIYCKLLQVLRRTAYARLAHYSLTAHPEHELTPTNVLQPVLQPG